MYYNYDISNKGIMMTELEQEKLEEMRQDMLLEEKLIRDLDYAIDYLDSEDKLSECISHLEFLSTKLSLYGWDLTSKDIMERVL